MEILVVLFLVSGLLQVGLALPLMAEKIKPNLWYGFRVKQTMEDPALWYAVNRYGAKRLLVSGLIFAAASVSLYFVPGLSVDGYAVGCLIAFGVPFTIGMSQTWQYLKQIS